MNALGFHGKHKCIKKMEMGNVKSMSRNIGCRSCQTNLPVHFYISLLYYTSIFQSATYLTADCKVSNKMKTIQNKPPREYKEKEKKRFNAIGSFKKKEKPIKVLTFSQSLRFDRDPL